MLKIRRMKIFDNYNSVYYLNIGVWLLIIQFLSGCAYKKTVAKYHPLDADTIIKSIKERNKNIRDLRGIANIQIISNNLNQRIREAIVINGNSLIRLELLNIIGQPSLIMVSDSKTVTIYNISENSFYHGDASPETIAKITGIYMTPHDIINLITGKQITTDFKITDLSFKNESRQYMLKAQSVDGGIYEEIWLDSANLSATEVKRFDDKGMAISFTSFSDYRKVGSHFFPFRIKMLIPSRGLSMSIEYVYVDLNRGVEESLFDLIIPEDAEAVELR